MDMIINMISLMLVVLGVTGILFVFADLFLDGRPSEKILSWFDR